MPFLDLIQPSDCLTTIANFLEPHDLQVLRCVSMGVKQSITGIIRAYAVERTRLKYSHPVQMPDGAIRIYSEMGRRKFDMYTIPDSFYSHPEYGAQTPMYTLKQDGQSDQIGHMICVGDQNAEYDGKGIQLDFTETRRNDIFIKGNEAVLSSCGIRIDEINMKRSNGGIETGKTTTIKMYVDWLDFYNVLIIYKFEVNWCDDELWFEEISLH